MREENGKVVRHAVERHRIIVTFDRDFPKLIDVDERPAVLAISRPRLRYEGHCLTHDVFVNSH